MLSKFKSLLKAPYPIVGSSLFLAMMNWFHDAGLFTLILFGVWGLCELVLCFTGDTMNLKKS